MSDKEMVDSTFRKLLESRKKLRTFVRDHGETFTQFAELVDEYNQSRAIHIGALKVAKVASPMYRMSIPRKFVCHDVESAKEFLKDRFPEFVELEPKVKTAAVRNVLDANTLPGIEMLFEEVEETPRHTGPKEIDLSALKGD